MRLVLATGNAHKLIEVRQILGGSYDVRAVDTGADESGDTFEANALIKARALTLSAGEVGVGDDSGIEIDHLGGAPGVLTARWAAPGDGKARALRELAGVEPTGRTCRYVCAAAAVWPDGREVVVRGEVEGVVVDAPRGEGGFGYDPIVAPLDGDGRTFGEMTPEEKHAISHRARAFTALAQVLVSPPS